MSSGLAWWTAHHDCSVNCQSNCSGVPLRFANPSSPSDWVEDLHLLAVEHAWHTEKGRLVPPFVALQRNPNYFAMLSILSIFSALSIFTLMTWTLPLSATNVTLSPSAFTVPLIFFRGAAGASLLMPLSFDMSCAKPATVHMTETARTRINIFFMI